MMKGDVGEEGEEMGWWGEGAGQHEEKVEKCGG